MAVVGQGVAEHDVGDILALDQHVGLADRVGLGVEFLPVDHQPRIRVELPQVLLGDGEHAAGAGGGVVEGAHDARLASEASSSAMNSRLTISRITSRGV